ncbi:sensor histidine kinase [Parerythrobacter aestuarii]|uniref:sensor histidine kinase n=1 Tax=Parerythrobacter aestuarii TaxID=3020909 RepID=UPI0024DEAF9F|nr:sensor histidine kinase [Parerythrobacter aestuarii]
MKKTVARFLAVLAAALLLVPIVAQAQTSQPVELPTGNSHAQPFESMRYLIADAGPLDPAAALARQAEFAPVTSPWIDFGDQEGAVWVLFTVHNGTGETGEWMLDIQRPFVEQLQVDKVAADGALETLLAVDRTTRFDERPVVSQYLVAPLSMAAGETAEILVGLRSTTGSWMPITIATPERMRTAHMQEARTNWAINGAILALALVALIVARLVGWKLALAFVAYVGLSTLFVANNEGYLHRFLWPGAMWAYEPANLILLAGMMIAVLQFARLFSNLPDTSPQANRWIKVLQGALLVVTAASAVFWTSDALRWLVFALVPVVAMAYFGIAWLAWRHRVLGAVPFMAGSLAILFTVAVMAGVLLAPGQFPMTVALDYFHATLLFEALAFFVAIMVRMLAMQAELNRSLAAEVATTREKLALADALKQSRDRYDAARDRAESLRSKLASTSHDLQQPLLSLRQGLRDIAARDEAAAGKLAAALDYLEGVTESGLADASPDDSLAGEKPDEGAESFPVGVVLDNCRAMFRGEAKAAGVALEVQPSDALVRAEPVALMRAVSNLVSNALKHAQASNISLSAEEGDRGVTIQVEDDGCGMDAQVLQEALQPYAKGEGSEGHGLGLALVRAFAAQPGYDLAITSKVGEGCRFVLTVPRGG